MREQRRAVAAASCCYWSSPTASRVEEQGRARCRRKGPAKLRGVRSALGKRPAMLRGGGEKVSGVQKQRQQKRGGPACAIEEARYPAEYGINGESPLLLQWALVYPLQRALRYPRPAGADSAPGATIMRRRQPVSWRNGGGRSHAGRKNE